jgi:uncharacterized protein YnzC (UPF0291/DUF896 family)
MSAELLSKHLLAIQKGIETAQKKQKNQILKSHSTVTKKNLKPSYLESARKNVLTSNDLVQSTLKKHLILGKPQGGKKKKVKKSSAERY